MRPVTRQPGSHVEHQIENKRRGTGSPIGEGRKRKGGRGEREELFLPEDIYSPLLMNDGVESTKIYMTR